MIDLKRCNGTYKCLIGQCMFKLSRQNACLTRFWNRHRYVDTFRRYLTKKQIDFLKYNWTLINSIEFISHKPFLFEIINKQDSCIEESKVKMYGNAKDLGFKVYVAEVIFLDNWNYEVELKRFDPGRL